MNQFTGIFFLLIKIRNISHDFSFTVILRCLLKTSVSTLLMIIIATLFVACMDITNNYIKSGVFFIMGITIYTISMMILREKEFISFAKLGLVFCKQREKQIRLFFMK